MFCPNCGEENPSDAHFCFKCGKSLSSLEHIHDSTIENVPNPGEGKDQEFVDKVEKRPLVAAIFSLVIIGSGQIYNGQLGLAIGLLILNQIGWIISDLLNKPLGAILVLSVGIGGAYNAYTTSKKMNNNEILFATYKKMDIVIYICVALLLVMGWLVISV